MSNIQSEYIQIFPSSIKRDLFPYARIITEQHIAELARSVAFEDSYVISSAVPFTYNAASEEKFTSISTADLFEFVIHGYYVKVTQGGMASMLKNISFSPNQDLWAHIHIDESVPDNCQLLNESSYSQQTSKFLHITPGTTVTVGAMIDDSLGISVDSVERNTVKCSDEGARFSLQLQDKVTLTSESEVTVSFNGAPPVQFSLSGTTYTYTYTVIEVSADTSGLFKAVYFTTANSDPDAHNLSGSIYSLKLFEYTNNNWRIPYNSRQGIDGGEV